MNAQLTILTLPNLPPEQLTIEVESRRKAAAIVTEWVEDVIGTAEGHAMNVEVLTKKNQTGVRHFDDRESE